MSKNIEGISSTYTSKQSQKPTAQLALLGVTQLAIARLVTNISKYKIGVECLSLYINTYR